MNDRRAYLERALAVALDDLGLVRDDECLTYNTYGGTVGLRVLDGAEQRWLRVTRQHRRGRTKEGWATSTAIPGVCKPMWYGTRQFDFEGEALRTDLLSLAPSPAVTSDLIITSRPPLSAEWFTNLRASIDALERWRTDRVSIRPETIAPSILGRVGSGYPSTVERYVTSHTDMHWCNLTAPIFCLLDWDSWGQAPYGFGPATLYCSSLLVPEVAEAIYETFGDQFATSDGQVSLLLAADHLLSKVSYGDCPGIADPLHDLIQGLVAR
jgi:hypothetical protein